MEQIPKTEKPALGRNEQLSPVTGISHDYFNKYFFLISFYKNGGIDNLKKELKILKDEGVDTRIPTYSEAYGGYDISSDDNNKEKIQEIDELSNLLNSMLQNPDYMDEGDFVDICNRLNFLVYGEEGNRRDI